MPGNDFGHVSHNALLLISHTQILRYSKMYMGWIRSSWCIWVPAFAEFVCSREFRECFQYKCR